MSANFFDVDVFYKYLSREIREATNKAIDLIEDRANFLAWEWSYSAESCIIAYRRTRQKRFLDLLIQSYYEILKLRDSETGKIDDIKGRTLNTWGSGLVVLGQWIAHITTAGRVTYPITSFVRIVNDEDLDEYKDIAISFLNSVIDCVREFDEDYVEIDGAGYNYYMRPGVNRIEPINHVHAFAMTLTDLYVITRNRFYEKRAREIAEIFQENLYLEENDSYSWPYFPKGSSMERKRESEPLWKSHVTAAFALHAYRNNIAFTEQDIHRFINTLKKNIVLDGWLSKFISPREARLIKKNDGRIRRRVSGIAGWMAYGDVDPEVDIIINEIVSRRSDYFIEGWFSNSNIARGYAYMLGRSKIIHSQ